MKKQITALLIAAITAASVPAFAAGDDEGEYVFNEEIAADYKTMAAPSFTDEAVLTRETDLVVRLGILSGYSDGTLRLNNTVTRAEAAAMLCRAINSDVEYIEKSYSKEGIEEERKTYEERGEEFKFDSFSDVALDAWYTPYVYAASMDMNCVSGYEDGTFRPERQVSELEFLSMLERAMGYSYMIEAEGGWSQGVITICNRLGLADNPSDAPATRERVVKMLYNALHSKVVTVESFNINEETGSIEQQHSRDKTLLLYWDIYSAHGKIKNYPDNPKNTLAFTPDEDVLDYRGKGRNFTLYGGKEYILMKKYDDIGETEGEYDVYIDCHDEENPAIIAAY